MTVNERMSVPIWKKIIAVFISFFILALQIFIIYALFNVDFLIIDTAWIYYLTVGIGIIYVLYILSKPMSSSYKLTWSILILIFPVFFCSLYSLNSTSRRLSKRKRNKIKNGIKAIPINDNKYELTLESYEYTNLVNVIQASEYVPVLKNCKYTFFPEISKKFEDLLYETRNAKKFILIETFILSSGKLMDMLYPILEQKGKEGVKIRILYDDIGSRGRVNRKLIKKLLQIDNCIINNYQPLGLNLNFLVNYRDHRKIYIIDGKIAYCGGDNLADEYVHFKERFGYWRDNCGKFQGKIVKSFLNMFAEMWYTSTKQILDKEFFDVKDDIFLDNKGYMIAFGDGPSNNANPAYDLFQSMICSATKYVYISTPYFIIDDVMISTIALKAKSGVDVCILTPKIPDKKSVFYMSRENYRDILKAGGRVYEYTPGFNHAKNIIVDDKKAFIGTINMDYRSLFLHYECGALILDDPEIIKMKQDFEQAILQSEEVSYAKWKKRPWYQRLSAFILNLFAPLF